MEVVDHGDIDLAAAQVINALDRFHVPHGDVQIGVGPAQSHEGVRQHRAAETGKRAQRDRAVHVNLEGAHVRLRLLDGLGDARVVTYEREAGLVEHHPTPVAHEKGHLDLALQLRDVLAHRRRRHMQARRRGRHRALGGECGEDMKPV